MRWFVLLGLVACTDGEVDEVPGADLVRRTATVECTTDTGWNHVATVNDPDALISVAGCAQGYGCWQTSDARWRRVDGDLSIRCEDGRFYKAVWLEQGK